MFQEAGIYHVYNRGCNRGKVFFNDENYRYLIRKLESSIEQFNIEVIAYCLMPNHYHLLVRQKSEIPVSKWLQRIFNGYSQAVNKQEKWTGTLFEGRPKHILIDSDRYLLEIIAYIHYNPVAARLVDHPDEWEFSNCLEWMGQRSTTLLSEDFIRTFISRSDYVEFLEHYSEVQQEKLLDRFDLEGPYIER